MGARGVELYTADSQAQILLTQLAIQTPNTAGYSLDNGLNKYNGKLWIGRNSALQTKIIAAFHSSAIGGHSGTAATYQRVKQTFYCKGIKQHVESFVKQCEICQKSKHPHTHPAGKLQPLQIPASAWQGLPTNFIEGLPKSDSCEVIMVVVDRLTKYAYFLPLKHPYTAMGVARVFLDNIVTNFMVRHSALYLTEIKFS